MGRYSAFRVFREGLRANKGWERAWRDPEPKPRYDVISIEPSEGVSIVTWDATLTLKGVFKLAAPLLALVFDRIGAKAEEGLQAALPNAVTVA